VDERRWDGAMSAITPLVSRSVAAGATTSSASSQQRAAAKKPMLRIGSTGPAVDAFKSALRQQHYWIDKGSTFTAATADAAMAFQKVNGLDRDGVVGPQTWDALKAPRTPDIGSGNATRVVVDLSDQVLMLVKHDTLKKVVNASTGNPNLADGQGIATPQGTFAIYEKRPGTDMGPNGPLYWPNYFTGGVAVHGSPSVPGYPASHGCVRVPMWLDEQLYNKLPLGTQVKVRS
jgi:lipoprotein-anchoring transpeptidase ErfK/SrfK